jgi:hypothetical protein
MRINVRITLDDSDLTLEEIAYILAGGDTPVATIADDIEIVEPVQEQIEIEEPEIVEETIEVVEETPEPEIVEEPEVEPEVEPEEEEQEEENQDEAVAESPKTTPGRGRARMIRPTRIGRTRRRGRKTTVDRSKDPVYSPRGISTSKEPRQPELEDIMGALTAVRVGLLKEHEVNTVGEFIDADDEELLRIMQMNWNEETGLGLAKRTARALITSFEKEYEAFWKAQSEMVQSEAPRQFDFSEYNIFLEVWNNIPNRKAGMYHSFTIALDTINRITERYENGNDVKHQDVLTMTNKVLRAIYAHANSPEFMLGGSNSGLEYLVVLTDAKWPSRTEIEEDCLQDNEA